MAHDHDHAGHSHAHRHAHGPAHAAPVAAGVGLGSSLGTTLLAMGAGRRLALASGLLVGLWLVVAWALSFGPAR